MSINEIDAQLIRQWKQEVCNPCRNSSNCPFVGEPYDPSRPYGIPKNHWYCWEDICQDGRLKAFVVFNDPEVPFRELDTKESGTVMGKPIYDFEKDFWVGVSGSMIVTNGKCWRVSGQRMQEPK